MKKALVIGINSYPTAPLKGAVNDAREFTQLLENHGKGKRSFNFDVKLHEDVRKKAELRKLVSEFFQGDCDTAVFYFSGHGYLTELGGYIVTPDSTQYDEGVSMEDILKLANKSKIKNRIIILDCCHAGVMGKPDVTDTKTFLSEGLTILTACRDWEKALEVNGHGVFTNLLLEGLRGGAADIHGHITPGGLYAYVDRSLGPFDQRPVFKTNVSSFVTLRETKPQVPVEVLKKLPEYFETPNSLKPLDPSYEFTNHPKEKHQLKRPYAKPSRVKIFKELQKMQSVGLVVPVKAPFMYFAAMNSTACKLTPLGEHYWWLAKKRRLK